ncbi:hypothetical protein ACGFNP_25220 [Nonomuraea sp. NPDC049269]|uniref:hypothetical protein n=1 Tax=Nonomuraea sp. NPDC049269 TaxID=3364349 RepID=UPI00371E236E
MEAPRGAVIEIVEKRHSKSSPPGGDVIIPNEIRINGQPVLAPKDHPVKVHEIAIQGDDVVLVTLTLFARRVLIAPEEPEETRA